jgi:hypothetical protein
MNEVVVEVPECPPSLNALAKSPWPYIKAKQRWHDLLAPRLQGLGPWDRVTVEGEITFPDRRKRDQGNHRFMLEKALGDVLQEVGALRDDAWDFYTFGHLAYRYEKGVRRTRLLLMPEVDDLEMAA